MIRYVYFRPIPACLMLTVDAIVSMLLCCTVNVGKRHAVGLAIKAVTFSSISLKKNYLLQNTYKVMLMYVVT